MIACICPDQDSTNHSVNTLRYADRLKTKSNKDNSDRMESLSKNSQNEVLGVSRLWSKSNS